MKSVNRHPVDVLAWGTHSIEEALRSTHARVHEIWVLPAQEKEYARHRATAKVHVVSRDALDRKLGTDRHQGVAARVTLELFPDVSSWAEGLQAGKVSKVLVLDQIEDPQNMGALFRSAHFFGFDAIVFPKDHSANLSGVVCKASSGAMFAIPTIRCSNLSRELKNLQELGFWCVGLDAGGQKELRAFQHRGSVALVVGNEGSGMRKLTQEKCDEIVSISSLSGWDSLNASVAAAIAMYEVSKLPVIS